MVGRPRSEALPKNIVRSNTAMRWNWRWIQRQSERAARVTRLAAGRQRSDERLRRQKPIALVDPAGKELWGQRSYSVHRHRNPPVRAGTDAIWMPRYQPLGLRQRFPEFHLDVLRTEEEERLVPCLDSACLKCGSLARDALHCARVLQGYSPQFTKRCVRIHPGSFVCTVIVMETPPV